MPLLISDYALPRNSGWPWYDFFIMTGMFLFLLVIMGFLLWPRIAWRAYPRRNKGLFRFFAKHPGVPLEVFDNYNPEDKRGLMEPALKELDNTNIEDAQTLSNIKSYQEYDLAIADEIWDETERLPSWELYKEWKNSGSLLTLFEWYSTKPAERSKPVRQKSKSRSFRPTPTQKTFDPYTALQEV